VRRPDVDTAANATDLENGLSLGRAIGAVGGHFRRRVGIVQKPIQFRAVVDRAADSQGSEGHANFFEVPICDFLLSCKSGGCIVKYALPMALRLPSPKHHRQPRQGRPWRGFLLAPVEHADCARHYRAEKRAMPKWQGAAQEWDPKRKSPNRAGAGLS